MKSEKKRIRVGVVGYGGAFNMGKVHLDDAAAAGFVPVAVADPDPSRLEIARKDFPGIETYPSLDALLKKSRAELVIIITPHNTHSTLAMKALKGGRHVVLEKPFAITTRECDAMIAEARKRKLVLSTYHNRHWDGCILKALEVVKSGVLGKIIRVESHVGCWGNPGDWWRTSKSISGGILYDWGVHLLEYTLQIIRAPIAEVSGFATSGYWAPKTRWKKDTNEDEGFLTIRFKGGQWATMGVTAVDSKPKEGYLEITGTDGTLVFDMKQYTVITHRGNDTVTVRGNNPDHQRARYYRNVADHLLKGTKLVITPEWARRPIHIIDTAVQSAKAGRALPVRYS